MRYGLLCDLSGIVDFDTGLIVSDAPNFIVADNTAHCNPEAAIAAMMADTKAGPIWRVRYENDRVSYFVTHNNHRLETIQRGGFWRAYRTGSPLMNGLGEVATFKTSDEARAFAISYVDVEAVLAHRPSQFGYLSDYQWRTPMPVSGSGDKDRLWLAKVTPDGRVLEYDTNIDFSSTAVANIVTGRAQYAMWRYQIGSLVSQMALWPQKDTATELYALHKQATERGWDFLEAAKAAGAAVLAWQELDTEYKPADAPASEALGKRALVLCGPLNRNVNIARPSDRLLQRVLHALDIYASMTAPVAV
jgi:hypothetical protein